jgi:leucyl aminopeptidase
MAPFQHINRKSPYLEEGGATLPIFAVTPAQIEAGSIDPVALDWARKAGFKAEAGATLPVPGEDGHLGGALFGLGNTPEAQPFLTGKLPRALPAGNWHLETAPINVDWLCLGFGLGAYSFDLYKAPSSEKARIAMPQDADAVEIARQLAAVYLVRDMVNTPTNDMGPDELESVFLALAKHYGAETEVIRGDDLIKRNFPLIHTVGRASTSEPRLLDMRWGRKGAPRLTLVGKGVCFDTGGLDIKPASSMLLMKKDMGGAANVLGLALLIMDAGLDIDLRVLVPAVENSIAGNAFRPSDIYTSRKGLTVQIDNTDAEGRLILADALAYADEEKPDLIIDMATLTGAARVALGPDVPPFFTDDEALAASLAKASSDVFDPIWRMPLFAGYEQMVNARIADLTNAPSGGMAGSITAALFLKRFVTQTPRWAHFDIFAWSQADKPHAPMGGEAQAIRAIYHVLKAGL